MRATKSVSTYIQLIPDDRIRLQITIEHARPMMPDEPSMLRLGRVILDAGLRVEDPDQPADGLSVLVVLLLVVVDVVNVVIMADTAQTGARLDLGRRLQSDIGRRRG